MRGFLAFLAGSVFGTGLLLSGMTDTAKVIGWLDLFGAWDPTLAFVMGGAIIPMAFAWAASRRRRAPVLGGHFPAQPKARITLSLATGSVLFGIGWGLAGLCPGPSLASLGFGGIGGVAFLVSMLAGMLLAVRVKPALDRVDVTRVARI